MYLPSHRLHDLPRSNARRRYEPRQTTTGQRQHMTSEEQQAFLAQNLRGLQNPMESLWWPPAVGWWVIAASIALLISTVFFHWARKRVQTPQVTAVIDQLDLCYKQWQSDHNAAAYTCRVNTLLKQTAVSHAGRKAVARLNGDEWLEWMEFVSASSLSACNRALLGQRSYQRTPPSPNAKSHAEIIAWYERYTEIASRVASDINHNSEADGNRSLHNA